MMSLPHATVDFWERNHEICLEICLSSFHSRVDLNKKFNREIHLKHLPRTEPEHRNKNEICEIHLRNWKPIGEATTVKIEQGEQVQHREQQTLAVSISSCDRSCDNTLCDWKIFSPVILHKRVPRFNKNISHNSHTVRKINIHKMYFIKGNNNEEKKFITSLRCESFFRFFCLRRHHENWNLSVPKLIFTQQFTCSWWFRARKCIFVEQ